MSDRGAQLLKTADAQIGELVKLISERAETDLRLPCPGRERLGDGSVGACAAHAAANYLRIVAFVKGEEQPPDGHAEGARPHRIPRFLRARGHAGGPDHGRHRAAVGIQRVGRESVLEQLSGGRQALVALAELSDEQLDAVAPASEMRFADGQRTLEQVLGSLLKHQSHQVDAVRAALT